MINSEQITLNAISSFSNYIPSVSELYCDQRTRLQKIIDRSLSLLRELNYTHVNFWRRVTDYFNPTYDYVENGKSWRAESEGLYVLIHGLKGHPSIWQTHIDQLQEETTRDLFVPYVPLQGNGPLEEVAHPILKVIEDYVAHHPTKPICLIGVSNGGRLCTWLEAQLRISAPQVPIKISTIAAVHFGSSRMNLVKRCHQWTGWGLGYDVSVIDDLCFGSNKAKEILDRVSQPLPSGVIRDFEFFGSTEDLQVPELPSSMPKLGNGLQSVNNIIHGYNHNSIVAGVAIQQVKSCQEWMKKMSN